MPSTPPSQNWDKSRLLHHKDARGETLTTAEKAIVDAFRAAVEQTESTQNKEFTERAESRIEAKNARNGQLTTLLERQMALRERLTITLRDAEAERQAIARERRQIEQAASGTSEIVHF